MAQTEGHTTVGERGTSVQQLYRELNIDETVNGDGAVESERSPEDVVTDVVERLFPDDSAAFDEELVKTSLDDLLVVLVALRSDRTHGKSLMSDLSGLFDVDLSPGTVYPRLHELEDEGILEMHELVRTKEYRIDDVDRMQSSIDESMRQHLALGLIMYSALEEL